VNHAPTTASLPRPPRAGRRARCASPSVTISPAWFDPGDVTGFITPFWTLWALHDALVKTMPGKPMAPSLAESWTVSADGKSYDFARRATRS
jgi:ABC-type transport system substrate-binding protein